MQVISYTKKTQAAITKYGAEKCKQAFEQNVKHGNGASTIAYEIGFPNTRAADSAINAGREIAAREKLAGTYSPEQIDTIVEWNIGMISTPNCSVLEWAEYNRSDANMAD
jgi:hypothetical protein